MIVRSDFFVHGGPSTMEGPVKRARRRQRKALRNIRKTVRKTNNQYRKNTRAERGTDFAATNNSKIGDMVTGLVDTAANAVSSYFAPQTSVPGMSGMRAAVASNSVSLAQQAASAAVIPEYAEKLDRHEEESAAPPWLAPAMVGGAALLVILALK